MRPALMSAALTSVLLSACGLTQPFEAPYTIQEKIADFHQRPYVGYIYDEHADKTYVTDRDGAFTLTLTLNSSGGGNLVDGYIACSPFGTTSTTLKVQPQDAVVQPALFATYFSGQTNWWEGFTATATGADGTEYTLQYLFTVKDSTAQGDQVCQADTSRWTTHFDLQLKAGWNRVVKWQKRSVSPTSTESLTTYSSSVPALDFQWKGNGQMCSAAPNSAYC